MSQDIECPCRQCRKYHAANRVVAWCVAGMLGLLAWAWLLSGCAVTHKASVRAQAAAELDRCSRNIFEAEACGRAVVAFCRARGLEADCGTHERVTRLVPW